MDAVASGAKKAPNLLGKAYVPKLDADEDCDIHKSNIRLRGGSFGADLTREGCDIMKQV